VLAAATRRTSFSNTTWLESSPTLPTQGYDRAAQGQLGQPAGVGNTLETTGAMPEGIWGGFQAAFFSLFLVALQTSAGQQQSSSNWELKVLPGFTFS